jgi:hypothetical protein
MKTFVQLWYRAELLLEWEMWQSGTGQVTGNVEKCGRAAQ